MIKIYPVFTDNDYQVFRELISEYQVIMGLDLSFQNLEKELSDLPHIYGPPQGRALLAGIESEIAGCVAVRHFAEGISEMKRLYVRPKFRNQGLGRSLSLSIIEAARDLGYQAMRLDTLASMEEAVALYTALGFKRIPPYRPNPLEKPIYMELKLVARNMK